MKLKYKFFALLILPFCFSNCNDKDEKPQTTQSSSENKALVSTKTETKQKTISTEEAVKIAEKQFKKYLPTILEAHNGYIDSQDTFTGDFTGDGVADVAIYFSLGSNDGGNVIVGQGIALYQNTGTSVKVIAGYEPDYLFNFKKISQGKIYVEKMEYAETDGRCCPSIKTEHVLKISGGKAY